MCLNNFFFIRRNPLKSIKINKKVKKINTRLITPYFKVK